jgi:HEAT repeat protein
MDLASAMPVVKKVLLRRDECTVELRRRALYLLGRQPNSESVPLMLDVAKNDTDQGIRREAMGWISRTAGDQGVPMLEDLLKNSNDEQTQRSVVQALGSIDTDKSRKAIRSLIERTDVLERVRAEAISALVRDRDNRAMAADDMAYLRALYLKVESQKLKDAVLSAVSRVEAPENEAWLLGIARNENESPSLRAQALQRLGRMTTISFTEIGKLYDSADSQQLRQQIIRALGERKEPEAVDKLVEVAKKDTDPSIRRYAIQILARSNNPKATQALKDLLP